MEPSSHRHHAKRWILHSLGIYLGIVAFTVIILVIVATRRGAEQSLAPNLANGFTALLGQAQPQQPFTGTLVPPHAPTLGPADAPITIIEFADFQCPYCQASVYPVRQLLREYPNQIRFVFRHFPITAVHPLAETLALAGMCAHDQGKFWAMHDALYAEQETVDRARIDAIAQSVGLDTNRFDLCLSTQQFASVVQRDFADGVQLGARGTPTWIINGQKVQGALPLETWRQIIDSSLAS